VTFIVHFSKGDGFSTTVPLNVIAAIAKARILVEEGWEVFITDGDGTQYQPCHFDKLESTILAAAQNTHPPNNT
jgi:hypothetical protein